MRERGRALACTLFALAALSLSGCGAGAPPPTPVSFLRQVPASAAQAQSGSTGSAADVSRLVAAAAGSYGVTRSFHSNTCGLANHTGNATLTPAADNRAFGLRLQTDTEGLTDVEYSVTLRDDGGFTAFADVAPHFRAQISGRVEDERLEFVEEIEILDESSPCRGQTVQARVTATKR